MYWKYVCRSSDSWVWGQSAHSREELGFERLYTTDRFLLNIFWKLHVCTRISLKQKKLVSQGHFVSLFIKLYFGIQWTSQRKTLRPMNLSWELGFPLNVASYFLISFFIDSCHCVFCLFLVWYHYRIILNVVCICMHVYMYIDTHTYIFLLKPRMGVCFKHYTVSLSPTIYFGDYFISHTAVFHCKALS